MRKRSTGATLIELLIYGILLLFLMAAVYGAFYMSRLYFSAAEGSTTAQQEAMKASAVMDRALADGASATLQVSTDPVGFRILSARSPETVYFLHDNEGDLLLQQWVVVWLDAETNQLMMGTQPLDTPVDDPANAAPNEGSVANMVDNPQVQTRVVAENVDRLEFPAALPGSFSYTVITETESPKFGTNSVRLTNTVPLRM